MQSSTEKEALLRQQQYREWREEKLEVEFGIFGVYLSYRFKVTEKQRNGRANELLEPNGPATRLRQLLGNRACFYSLKWHNLFLTKEDAEKHLIYNRETLRLWKRAIRKLLDPPYYFCLEVGTEGEIHVHVIADYWAGLKGIRRDGKVIRLLTNTLDDWHRTISYMNKTPVPLTVDHDDITKPKLRDWQERLSDYQQGMVGKIRPPYLSGFVFS